MHLQHLEQLWLSLGQKSHIDQTKALITAFVIRQTWWAVTKWWIICSCRSKNSKRFMILELKLICWSKLTLYAHLSWVTGSDTWSNEMKAFWSGGFKLEVGSNAIITYTMVSKISKPLVWICHQQLFFPNFMLVLCRCFEAVMDLMCKPNASCFIAPALQRWLFCCYVILSLISTA